MRREIQRCISPMCDTPLVKKGQALQLQDKCSQPFRSDTASTYFQDLVTEYYNVIDHFKGWIVNLSQEWHYDVRH